MKKSLCRTLSLLRASDTVSFGGGSRHKAFVGRYGEWVAAVYLRLRGYRILIRNYSVGFGEIDLVVTRGKHLRIVEVRAVTATVLECPTHSVSPRKQRQVLRVAKHLMQREQFSHFTVSLDVIGVWVHRWYWPKVIWLRDCFEDGEVEGIPKSERR